MKKIKINWKIFILVIEIFIIGSLLFMFVTKKTIVKGSLLRRSQTDILVTEDSITYDNTIKFTNQILKENDFFSSKYKRISIDTLITQSSKFLIFFSQDDCEYCVYELIHIATQQINEDDAVIIPLCSNIKMLQFANKNYFTKFDFYTACPHDDAWKEKVHTPFIAFVPKENFTVNHILSYEANDTIRLKKFIRRNIENFEISFSTIIVNHNKN